MAAESRAADPAVTEPIFRALLQERPWEFNFFQTVRILQRILPFRQQVGKMSQPMDEVAHFHAHASMAFPASQIQQVEWPEARPEDRPIALRVNFMGLYGPMGALPLYYTEYILQRQRLKDTALADFLDIFNHRLISLFYQAWEKYRFYVAYERGERDRLSKYLMSMVGLGTPGLSRRYSDRGVRDESLLFYAGIHTMHSRSALGLKQVVADYFEVPVEVEQYIGAWYPLEPSSQCQFADGDSFSERLGQGAIVGDEVWDPQSGVRLRLGPLTIRQYLDFLPEGSAYRPLKALTEFFSNGELSFELQLVLKQGEVPPCNLGADEEAGPRLGWLTWAKTADMHRDPDETILRL